MDYPPRGRGVAGFALTRVRLFVLVIMLRRFFAGVARLRRAHRGMLDFLVDLLVRRVCRDHDSDQNQHHGKQNKARLGADRPPSSQLLLHSASMQ